MRPQRPSLGWWKRQQEDVDINDFEQGRKVAIALFRENTRSLDTLGNLLTNRWFSKSEDIRLWEKRNTYVPEPPVFQAGENPHGFPCSDPWCERCDAGIKRLLRDCGVLPKGKPDIGYVAMGRAMVRQGVSRVRHRMDESDR